MLFLLTSLAGLLFWGCFAVPFYEIVGKSVSSEGRHFPGGGVVFLSRWPLAPLYEGV